MPQITVHFSSAIINRIGTGQLADWGNAMRAWFHEGDPDRVFGRDAPNSPQGTFSFAYHLHMVPSDEALVQKWELIANPHYRTSDRFIIYSLDRSAPLKYGMYLLDMLGDPGAHQLAFTGPEAQERRELWEDLAWGHQMGNFDAPHSA